MPESSRSAQPQIISDDVATLLDLDPLDRQGAEALLQQSIGSPGVAEALGVLEARLGTFPSGPPTSELAQDVWICAMVLFAPRVQQWHLGQSVDDEISRATLADVGRQFRLHRITHGEFGLETWWWLSNHLAGGCFELGRLHVILRRLSPGEPSPPRNPQWILDVHIPPTGPLTHAAVESSFAQAIPFFRRHFPDRPADTAVCFSWLLDPYLAEHLPTSNIARFQQLFHRHGEDRPSQKDAIYFVFRTRNLDDLDRLPRDTALQRLVLDRIAAGGTWQCCHGFRHLA
ncbi:hypothetical protein ABIB25_004552 [Nakamurella sp. UYEF19]|uniref:acyltransferase domain-containing protein n=1 Tax=Nakamurella sp. UYEF19 TaxID=1756392 RepID=UPI0033938CB2